MSDLDELWEALEPHIEWAEHLALILLFAMHPLGVDDLRGRAEGVLAADGRTLRVLIPRDLGELGMVTRELAVRPERTVGAVWVELWRGSGDADWDRSVVDQLGRLNEVRSLIERELGRPLVLVLPTALRTSLYVLAPDLWTIRSFTAVVPSPAVVTRGPVEQVPVVQEIVAVGPPSAAEREWARIMANASAGALGRVNPWDGFRAVDAAMQRGSLLSARAIGSEALAVAEALATAAPESSSARRDLAAACDWLGDVELEAGNLSAARDLYQRSLDLGEGLVKADPDSAQAQRDLSVSLNKLGDVEMEAANWSAARGLYQRSLSVSERLAKEDPHSAQAQRDLSVSLNNLGDVELQSGNLSAARGLYQRSLNVREGLATADPHSAEVQRDVSASLNKLGDVEMAVGDLSTARVHYQRSLDINEALAKADPLNAQASFDVVDLHLCLVTLADRVGDTAALKHHLQAARERMQELEANGHVAGYVQREAARDRIAQLQRDQPSD